jgi:NAD(P)-dependent dehydrogenase (short-subunit alcohol dehydrogenase family)
VKGLAGGAALVTGSGRGIGRAIALRLAEEGMTVGVNDLDGPSAVQTVRTIEEAGGKAIAVPGDVSREPDAQAMVHTCVERLGGLDTLVNNAGVDFAAPVAATDDAAWSKVHAVDLHGPFLLVRAAVEPLARRGGSVVNMASTHALATVPYRSAYAAAKAGVVGLTRALAVELGSRGIRVNAVLPGYVRTAIWNLWLDKAPDPQALLARIAGRHPLRRLGTPEDVAAMVAFLSSADAGFVTGATFVVDGGYTAQLEPPE